MSKASKAGKAPIQNAGAIIEKFGGIRPMASKMGVAVTTVQGWKKRDAIPAARLEETLKSAQEHNIDLSDIIEGAEPNEDVAAVVESVSDEEASEEAGVEKNKTSEAHSGQDDSDDKAVENQNEGEGKDVDVVANTQTEEVVVKKQDEFSRRPIVKKTETSSGYTEIEVHSAKPMVSKVGIGVAVGVCLVVLMIVVATIMPNLNSGDNTQEQARIETLEAQIASLKEEQGRFKGLKPENWKEDLAAMKAQLNETTAGVAAVAGQVKQVSQEIIADPKISERAAQLQNYISTVTEGNAVFGLLEHFNALRDSDGGESILDGSVTALGEVFAGAKGQSDAQINAALASARSKNEALQATLGNVPQDELKAAALLLAMTQVRSALARPEESFDGDLDLLMGMVGEENGGLHASLEKIAPHSKSGVLSGSGLRKEFQTVAGEVVEASLKGEDVSFSEKLSARFNDILQVEKDGEMVTGTDTQAKLHAAEKMIEQEQWSQAVDFLNESMSAKELAPLKPWISKVEAAVSASTVRKALDDVIQLNFGDGMLGGRQLLSQQ